MANQIVSGVDLYTTGASTPCACGATAIQIYWGERGRGNACMCPECGRWANDIDTFVGIVANGGRHHNGTTFGHDFRQLHLCRCGGMGEKFQTTGTVTQWQGIKCKLCKFQVKNDGWEKTIRQWIYTMEEDSRFYEAFGRFFISLGYRKYRTL